LSEKLSIGKRYVLGLYWSLQTITTVGYGDFGSGNIGEIILTTAWMCIGVAFYLVAVGAVTSNIVSSQSSGDELEVSHVLWLNLARNSFTLPITILKLVPRC
jgi:hypothetical protein